MLQTLPIKLSYKTPTINHVNLFCWLFRATVYAVEEGIANNKVPNPHLPAEIATRFCQIQIDSGISWHEFLDAVYRQLIYDDEYTSFYIKRVRTVDFVLSEIV
jgi:hypothetical protein